MFFSSVKRMPEIKTISSLDFNKKTNQKESKYLETDLLPCIIVWILLGCFSVTYPPVKVENMWVSETQFNESQLPVSQIPYTL